MKISSKEVGRGPVPMSDMVMVNISVEFNGPTESMTMSVTVPNVGTEKEKSDRALARAKGFVRQFADLPSGEGSSSQA